MREDRDEIPPGTLEMLILQTLANGQAMHGFAIADSIQQRSDDVLQVEEGSLYPALQRLAVKGWVKTEWGQSANNRRARYYKLTATGRRQLTQEFADFERLLDAIMRIMQPT